MVKISFVLLLTRTRFGLHILMILFSARVTFLSGNENLLKNVTNLKIQNCELEAERENLNRQVSLSKIYLVMFGIYSHVKFVNIKPLVMYRNSCFNSSIRFVCCHFGCLQAV